MFYVIFIGERCHIMPKKQSIGYNINGFENELYEYICGIVGPDKIERNTTELIDGKEIDIYIPHKKLAFEFNGLRWHSEKCGKGKNYHLSKTEECFSKGVSLIQIFEDEWRFKKRIVLSIVSDMLCFDGYKKRINPKKCVIKEVGTKIARDFLIKNHINGYSASSVYLGAYYNDSLIALMSFKIRTGKSIWEMTRFCVGCDYSCQDISVDMFGYFIKKFAPEKIVSIYDRRWVNNNGVDVFDKLNFQLKDVLPPIYYYTDCHQKREPKTQFKKQTLHRKYGFPLDITEVKMAENLGYYRIWDCGLFKYVWKK